MGYSELEKGERKMHWLWKNVLTNAKALLADEEKMRREAKNSLNTSMTEMYSNLKARRNLKLHQYFVNLGWVIEW